MNLEQPCRVFVGYRYHYHLRFVKVTAGKGMGP